jgi:hypothetical protein
MGPAAQIEGMNEIDFPIDKIPAEVKALGRAVADRVVYRFDFLLDPARLKISLGELHSGLRKQLWDALYEIRDPRYPIVRLAERADWVKLGHA